MLEMMARPTAPPEPGGTRTEAPQAPPHAPELTRARTRTRATRPRRQIIERPRLTKLLDEATARIIVLVAPAGYGKTTVLRQWRETRPRAAFLEVRPQWTDIVAMSRELTEGVVQDAKHSALLRRLAVSEAPPPSMEDLLRLVIRDITTSRPDAVVIDSYHLATASRSTEDFLRDFVLALPCPVILAARHRPPWVTARHLLYDEVLEIDRRELVFTPLEARALLRFDRKTSFELHAATGGWPAMLSLAAAVGQPVRPESLLSPTLREYLADELLRLADGSLRGTLRILARLPRVTEAALSELHRDDWEQRLSVAAELGFIEREDDTWRIQPLIRQFLLEKYPPENDPSLVGALERMSSLFLEQRDWDSAFVIVNKLRSAKLFDALLEASLYDLLKSGRADTLHGWLALTSEWAGASPVNELAEAELAMRAGAYDRAHFLASRCASRFPSRRSDLRARALYVAGRAAVMHDTYTDVGLALLTDARRLDKSLASDVVWAQFSALLEVDASEAQRKLDEYMSVAPRTPTTEMRNAVGLAILLSEQGFVHEAIHKLRPYRNLLSRVDDPMVRGPFLNRLAYLYVLASQYEEGLVVAQEAMRDAESSSLTFAHVHTWIVMAGAELGSRRFKEATALIARTERTAAASDDAYAQLNARTLRARVHLALGDYAKAMALTAAAPTRVLPAQLIGEYLATRSMCQAAAGKLDAAEGTLRAARDASSHLEARSFALAVEAILYLRAGGDPSSAVERVGPLLDGGCWDPLVAGYRCYPPLLTALLSSARSDLVTTLVRQAHDELMAWRLGFAVDAPDHLGTLTPREREVLSLIAAGLSNRDIAKQLVITEATAKLHTRRVLTKLGVKSRTQAAISAAVHGATLDRGGNPHF